MLDVKCTNDGLYQVSFSLWLLYHVLDQILYFSLFILNQLKLYLTCCYTEKSSVIMVKWNKYNCLMLWLLQMLLMLQSMPSVVQSSITSNKTAIHVAAFLPFTSSRKFYLGLDQIESVNKALIDINNKENMLQDYELKVIFYYTKVRWWKSWVDLCNNDMMLSYSVLLI